MRTILLFSVIGWVTAIYGENKNNRHIFSILHAVRTGQHSRCFYCFSSCSSILALENGSLNIPHSCCKPAFPGFARNSSRQSLCCGQEFPFVTQTSLLTKYTKCAANLLWNRETMTIQILYSLLE